MATAKKKVIPKRERHDLYLRLSDKTLKGRVQVMSDHENHLWDCYVLCILGAVLCGIFPTGYALETAENDEEK